MDIFGVLSLIGRAGIILIRNARDGCGTGEDVRRKAGAHSGESDIESVKSDTARCRASQRSYSHLPRRQLWSSDL